MIDLWPYMFAVLGGLLAVVTAYVTGRKDARQKSKATEARLETIKEVRRHEREAETQDDPELVRRLTR
jgi:ABC-type protease/lipase transport system fused ATPase/permease subunit